MLNLASIMPGSPGWTDEVKAQRAQALVAADLLHRHGVAEVARRAAELVGHVLLRFLERILRVICMRATRSPAARIPPMPEACVWAASMPRGSPVPT